MGRRHKPRSEQKQSHNLKIRAALIEDLLRLTIRVENNNVVKELEACQELFDITNRLNTLEQNDDDGIEANSSSYEKFYEWLRDNSAEIHDVEIDEFNGYGRGLRTTKELQQGNLVIAIPRKLMMSRESALQSDFKDLFTNDEMLKTMENVSLAMHLLCEKFKGPESFYAPYISVLPKRYTTVLGFSHEEMMELAGSPTLKQALQLYKNICRQYAYFSKRLRGAFSAIGKRFTFREYCWAVQTVMTRQNSIPSADRKTMINALIPFWDFCNHTSGSYSTDYNPTLDRSECLALKNVKSDQQFFIFYGPRTNRDFFIHNGFVYGDNENDGYELPLGISCSDPLRGTRLQLLEKIGIDALVTGTFLLTKIEPINPELLAFLRVFNMNDEQLQHWLASEKSADLKCIDCALDTSLEKKTWSFLQTRIKLILAAYKTTMDDDTKLLSDDVTLMSENRTLAVQMRCSEKHVLRTVLDYVEQYTKQ